LAGDGLLRAEGGHRHDAAGKGEREKGEGEEFAHRGCS
jgi:hypothetical protein